MYTLRTDLQKFSYTTLDLSSSRVVVRSCLNVTLDDESNITDATRFYESLPLIKELALSSPNVVIMAHLGRPATRDPKLSFKKLAEKLQEELNSVNVTVNFIEDLDEASVQKITSNINTSNHKEIFFLENIRFFPDEESKDKEKRLAFAKRLAALGNAFINDAFADYRESASTYDIATLLPSYLGPVFLKEVDALTKLNNSKRPLISILGGAKLSEKLDVVNSMLEFSDKVIIGGAMAYTILKAKGIQIGKSLVELDKLDVALELLNKYSSKLLLPVDHLVSDEFSKESGENGTYLESVEIPEDKIAIDIGLDTIEIYKAEIAKASSIIWNGPMGVFEWNKSSLGTKEIGEAIVNNIGSYKVVGGGDSIAAINKFKLTGFDHISTGGGAMLSLLAYDKFPTLDVIINK